MFRKSRKKILKPSLRLIFNVKQAYKQLDLSYWFYKGSFNAGYGDVTARYDFQIDWGDGSPIEYYNDIDSETVNIYTDRHERIKVSHNYQTAGVRVITITGTCENLFGYNTLNKSLHEAPQFEQCLWGVYVPKNCQSPLHYGHGSFFSCKNMRYVGKRIFDNLRDCTALPHLFDGASIEYIPDDIFANAKNLNNVEYIFEACQMKQIPSTLFRWCPNINNVRHAFHRCNKLQQIPQGLFDHNPLITNVESTFKACQALTTVPQNLFDKCPLINNATQCFAGGKILTSSGNVSDQGYNKYMKIQTNLPPLWQRNKNISHSQYATGCVKATNYQDALQHGWV